QFYAIGDNYDSLRSLSDQACPMQMNVNVLIDTDLGMHRTGVDFDSLLNLYEHVTGLKGIILKGLHCYDGHCHQSDFNERRAVVEENDKKVLLIRESLRRKGLKCEILVMGGTPTFPCRTGKPDLYLSPGTLFINDWGYYSSFPDLAFTPGAAVFTRVVSHQGSNTFTIDLGHKGIGADPAGARGIIAGLEEAKPILQSEEHWVFSLPSGAKVPAIGSVHYVIPTHICPTTALYPEVQVASGGRITERWKVDARNRKITF
ncbi:MAG: alanine racemase, partial [Treponema sp.]|nr:alanine racemase [Treponema sp.]